MSVVRRAGSARVPGSSSSVADREHRRARGRAAPDERPQPGEQHDERERLRQEVVGAGVERLGLVVLAVLGGEHEDRRPDAFVAQRRGTPCSRSCPAAGCRGRWRRRSPPGPATGRRARRGRRRRRSPRRSGRRRPPPRAVPRPRPPGRASPELCRFGSVAALHGRSGDLSGCRSGRIGVGCFGEQHPAPARGSRAHSRVLRSSSRTRCVAAPRFDPPPPDAGAAVAGTPCTITTKASTSPMTATFAGLGLHADLVAALARRGHHRAVPDPGAHHRRRPRRPRRLRQGQDRLGQDPRLRPPAARAGSARPSPAAPRAWSSCRPASWPPRSRDALAPARRGARPQGRAPSTAASSMDAADRPRCRRASTSSSARPAASSTCIERGELSVADVEVLVLDEADRMADMGFMPQVQKILLPASTRPHQTMLFSATLDGAVDAPRRPLHARPGLARGRVDDEPTVDEMDHRFLARAPDGQGEGRRRRSPAASTARSCSCAPSAAPTASSRSSSARACERRRHPRRPAPGRAGAGARRLHRRARCQVLVATDVAARGIHVDGVDVVVHYDPPEDDEGLPPPLGPHGARGESGVAVTLMLWNQENDDPRDPAAPRPPDPGGRGLLQRPPPRRPRQRPAETELADADRRVLASHRCRYGAPDAKTMGTMRP